MAPAPRIAAVFARWRSRLFPKRDEDPRHALGRRGEALAARFLREQGYKVIYRNFRPRGGGEIDLVCRDGQTLVFVEVKTRSSTEFGRPAEAVDAEKQWLVGRGARAWLRLLNQSEVVHRFDIVEVVVRADDPPEYNLIREAFTMPEQVIY